MEYNGEKSVMRNPSRIESFIAKYGKKTSISVVALGAAGLIASLGLQIKSLYDTRETQRIDGVEQILNTMPFGDIPVDRTFRIWNYSQEVINDTPELKGTDPNLVRMYILGMNQGAHPRAGEPYRVLVPKSHIRRMAPKTNQQ